MSSDVSERVQLDVDLDDTPRCEAQNCLHLPERPPAVARVFWEHRCKHQAAVLICRTCLTWVVGQVFRPTWVLIICQKCGDSHQCALVVHVDVQNL